MSGLRPPRPSLPDPLASPFTAASAGPSADGGCGPLIKHAGRGPPEPAPTAGSPAPGYPPGWSAGSGPLCSARRRRPPFDIDPLLLRRYSRKATGLPGNDQAALVGEDDELGAVPGVELHQDPRYMRFAGQRADEQALSDLGVRQARGDEPEDLDLPGGER